MTSRVNIPINDSDISNEFRKSSHNWNFPSVENSPMFKFDINGTARVNSFSENTLTKEKKSQLMYPERPFEKTIPGRYAILICHHLD